MLCWRKTHLTICLWNTTGCTIRKYISTVICRKLKETIYVSITGECPTCTPDAQKMLRAPHVEQIFGDVHKILRVTKLNIVFLWNNRKIWKTSVMPRVGLKSSIFWDITSCSPLKIDRRFGEASHFHHHLRKNKETSVKAGWKQSLLSRVNGIYGVISQKI
jgi:hypothetical protein